MHACVCLCVCPCRVVELTNISEALYQLFLAIITRGHTTMCFPAYLTSIHKDYLRVSTSEQIFIGAAWAGV